MRKDDGSLVEAVRAGRAEFFAELIDRHAGAVFRIVRAAVANDADAEDVAQDVFLASYRSLESLRDPRRFRAHLVAIATRKVIDHLRRRNVRSKVMSLIEEPEAPGVPEAVALVRSVERIVGRLDEDSRLVFALRHHEGLSCVQIARLLDVSRGTIHSRIARIHAVIRARMEIGK